MKYLYSIKDDNKEYKFNFTQFNGHIRIDCMLVIRYDGDFRQSISGYLSVKDKKIFTTDKDPLAPTPLVKNYMERLISLLAFS